MNNGFTQQAQEALRLVLELQHEIAALRSELEERSPTDTVE
jgi:hypothetical protein